jgi:hypothetical protein
LKLAQIPQEHISQVWPLATDMLSKAVEYSNGVSLAEEGKLIASGIKQLWMVIDDEAKPNKAVAAGITSIKKHSDGTKTANIEMFGGENMKAWFALKGDFEAWAKDEGCADIRLYARKGWAKHLPDYALTHYMMRKAL